MKQKSGYTTRIQEKALDLQKMTPVLVTKKRISFLGQPGQPILVQPQTFLKVQQSGRPESSFLQGLKKLIPPSRLSRNQSPHIDLVQKKQLPLKKFELKGKNKLYVQKFLGAVKRNRARKAYKILLKKYKYRKSVILELISTEEGYVKDLDIIILQILQPLLESKTITSEQGRLLSSNIHGLRQLNREFLETLKEQFPNGYVGPYQCIGDLLMQYVPFFKLYFQYYIDYKKIDQTIQLLKTQNSKFNAFSVKMSNSKDFRFLDVDSFLVKPVQRLPKYVLLFNDLLKHTDPSHPDYSNIQKASKSYSDVTNANNSQLDKVLQNSRLSSLQREFPDVNIFVPNRDYISQVNLQMFQKNKLKPVYVYLTNDLIIVASRNDTKPKLESYIILNQQSVVKGLDDSQYFQNLFTLIGENDSITFADQNLEKKENTLIKFEEIIQELRDKSDSRKDALNKNQIKVENKSYSIEIAVLGTEQRNAIKPYTIYIIEVMISNITQTIYLRYSELLEIQIEIQKLFPKLKKFVLDDRTWHSGNQAKEVESRSITIISFLSTLLLSQDFKSSPLNTAILLKLGLPIDFYLLPDMLIQEQNQGNSPVREVNDDEVFNEKSKPVRLNNLNLDKTDVDIRAQRKNQDFSSVRNGRSGIFDKKVSSSVLIRAAGQSVDRNQTPEVRKTKKETSITINIISFHPTKPSISMQINQDTKTLDLYEKIIDNLDLNDIFDYKFLIPICKTKTFRPLANDEILINLFSSNVIMETLFSEKKEIHFKKYIFLEVEQETVQFQMDQTKLNMVYLQFIHELENYYLTSKDYYQLAAMYLFINSIKKFQIIGIPVQKNLKFPYDKLADIVPSSILKNTKKDIWQQNIPEFYDNLVEQFKTEEIIESSEKVQQVKLQFISFVWQNQLCGKQLFQVQPTKETLTILKTSDTNIFIAVYIQGLIFFDQRKKIQLLSIDFSKLNLIKPFAGILQIEDSVNRYFFNCPNGYQIKQLVDEYVEIQEKYMKGDPDDIEEVEIEAN